MKNCIILWLFLGVHLPVFGQTLHIIDEETGQDLELVTLFSKEPYVFSTTDATGKVDISAFKHAREIEVRLTGFQKQIVSYEGLLEAGLTLTLLPDPVYLDQVIISATRWRATAGETPHRIAQISRKEIALNNPQTAADLLGLSGEVFIQKSQQGGGSPMLRGFAANRLLYVIDGVRMNTAIFRSGNLQNVISLDPLATENTEVFFGPGSVIYGSDAIGGVMSFQTLSPQLSRSGSKRIQGSAFTRYASANHELSGHVDVQAGWKKWALLSSISANRFGDLRMGKHGPDAYLRPFYVQYKDGVDTILENEDPRIQNPSAYAQVNLMQKLRFQPNRLWDIRYGFHYSTTGSYGRYDRHLRTQNGQPRSAEWNYGPQRWMMHQLSLKSFSPTKLYDEMQVRGAFQYFEESRIDRNFASPLRRTREEQVNAYSVNADFTKTLQHQTTFMYGIEWVLNTVHSQGTQQNIIEQTQTQSASRYPDARWSSYAVYGMMQHYFSKKLHLELGLRYNGYTLQADFRNNEAFFPLPETQSSLENHSWAGSFGGVYQPDPTWKIGFTLGTGFRAPNVDDVGKIFDSEPGAVVVPNPTLAAERAYNAEVTLHKAFGEGISWDMSVYYTHLGQALVRRKFTLQGQDSIVYDGVLSQVQAIQNAAFARVYGIQAGVEITLPGHMTLRSRINVQEGEEVLDDGQVSPSRHAVPWFGSTQLRYAHKQLRIQLIARYSGRRSFENLSIEERGKPEIYAKDAQGRPYSPSWYTLNVNGLYEISPGIQLSLGLENLTNRRYRPYSSGITAAGRSFIVALRMHY